MLHGVHHALQGNIPLYKLSGPRPLLCCVNQALSGNIPLYKLSGPRSMLHGVHRALQGNIPFYIPLMCVLPRF